MMGLSPLLSALLATQVPACPQAAMMAELGAALPADRLRAAIAAAARHPLGSRENPVRVCGPMGERAYLARLRCADGQAPRIGRRGSVGAGPFGSILDLYPLDCGSAAPGQTELHMDMYHSEAETRPAPGFTIEQP
jgi:hypothetical protein